MEPAPEPPSPVIPGSLAPFPVLVQQLTDNRQTLFSISDRTSRTVDVPELSGRYMATSYGWMLVLGPRAGEAFLWNPQSGEKIQLPDTGEMIPSTHCCCLLSDDVSSPNCGVLVYEQANPNMWYCRVNGGVRWHPFWYDIGSKDVPDETGKELVAVDKTFYTIASLNGRFYFYDTADTIGTIDFIARDGAGADPDPAVEFDSVDDIRPIEHPEGAAMADSFMVVSDGELFQVLVFFALPKVDTPTAFGVYRMDLSEPASWRRTDDIGDRVFLLGPYNSSSACSASECGLKSNLLYWVHDDVNCLYIFDLEDGSVTTVQPCQGPPDPDPKAAPFWMLPIAR